MVGFLTGDWFDELAVGAARVRASGLSGEAPVTVRQVVTGGPDGDVVYDLRLAGGTVTLVRPAVGTPDVAFEQDHDTARRLARGDTHPHLELAAGRLRISGAANRLLPWGPVLDALDDELAGLRARTNW